MQLESDVFYASKNTKKKLFVQLSFRIKLKIKIKPR